MAQGVAIPRQTSLGNPSETAKRRLGRVPSVRLREGATALAGREGRRAYEQPLTEPQFMHL